MAKVKPLWRYGVGERYVTDETGSRCRDLTTGRWTKCDLCKVCVTKDGKRAKRRAGRKRKIV